ncbi:Barstar, RNAse (barnase) inhibitor [Paenimyroides ummariense]|uniref:Barstar, RNAse (Barnase) inhibitor n=1 Tax=Paenimyroides ummariense TaxID=913024 RepID=A0A1I5G5V5_9FLAO|nr:ribonuclease inhibitor [Paenimyroides ummariense]SFO31455.1 Barstar, RNAse (barnase) inhibitor [Paenimyroides ummariense]
MTKKICINGNNISDKESLYQEINRVFMAKEEWKIGESLDALNDLFYGGFGLISGNEPIELTWKNFDHNKELFGYDFTMEFYQEKLKQPKVFSTKIIQQNIRALENGTGLTYFDMILEMIADHKNITLIIE